MKILIMADLRGTLLQEKIQHEHQKENPHRAAEIEVTVQVMEGAMLDNIIKKMNSKYRKILECDLLYIHAGVNNLTSKKGAIVQPVFDEIPELVDIITDKITSVKLKLHKSCKNIVMVQIVGIDIGRYNREMDGFWYYQQIVINEAMPILAHTINVINKADNLVGVIVGF